MSPDDLGLADLTDDQLVALARLVAVELGNRSGAVQGAARAATLEEAERVRIARQAAEVEAARLRNAERERIREAAKAEVRAAVTPAAAEGWRKNKTIGLMAREVLGPGWTCQIWRRDKDIRVYFDRKLGEVIQKVLFFASGNDRNPPGSLKLRGLPDIDRAAVMIICGFARKHWSCHPSFDCDEAAACDVAAIPYPDTYLAHHRSAA